MKRKKFIKTSFFGSLALSIFPHLSFTEFQEKYSRDQLIGKGNLDLTGDPIKMQKDAYASFLKMQAAAHKENISIELVSAFRSFERQKQIFENKYTLYTSKGLTPTEAIDKIIEYSTIPGTSRHHWGTDIDIIDSNAPKPESVLLAKHFSENGPFFKLKEWLLKNANSYGFYEVYTNDPSRKGFKYEPWHYSYAPVSKPMLQAYCNLDIRKVLQEEVILGSDYFSEAFINKYLSENILDINPELL